MDAREKAEWLKESLPVGTKVRVIDYDCDVYIGEIGEVIGHDIGADDELPGTRIKFADLPTDLFFDEEIERI